MIERPQVDSQVSGQLQQDAVDGLVLFAEGLAGEAARPEFELFHPLFSYVIQDPITLRVSHLEYSGQDRAA